ncbi:MAG: fumarylacetoacetate hydrolase family protein [Anaerolineae bacterium]|nr:fumarylacetoacetate hydrolase family protein [Anaerolineae bacterium]
MELVRFYHPDLGARLGLVKGQTVYDLVATGKPALQSVAHLLRASVERSVLEWLREVEVSELTGYGLEAMDRVPSTQSSYLLPPVDRQEVWAAGVTYAWSREARVREAVSKEIYVKVYEAERPELFFKSLPEKVVGPNDWVGIRGDSRWNVPEPELALVLNPKMEIVGYTVGNDMSSRDIEGENPLYLPQAKVYRHSCALGPAIVLADDVKAQDLAIHLDVVRGGEVVFAGDTNTAKIHRDLSELAGWLGRNADFPYGAVLLTGTGIVPGDEFTLQDGDEVSISIAGIGVLSNTVKQM